MTYEQRLRSFAEGKRLARLSSAVYEHDGTPCDACGSPLPRVLVGLKDVVTGRHYFVGQNCLAWLMDEGLIARARYRQSAKTAFREEMALRALESGVDGAGNGARNGNARDGGRRGGAAQPTSAITRSVVIVTETDAGYRAAVRLSNGESSVKVRVSEPAGRLAWVRENGALVATQTKSPSHVALSRCVQRAYAEALAALQRRDGVPTEIESVAEAVGR